MAKQQSTSEPADVVFFFARARGGGEVVAQAVKALTEAVERSVQPRLAPKAPVKVLPPTAAVAPKADDKTLFDPEEVDAADASLAEEVEQTDDSTVARPTPPKREPRARKAPSYSIVKDLDLRPDGKQALKAFFAEKKPADQQEQIAVVVYYMAKVLEMSGITTDHLYTCLKDVGVKVPTDIPQIARNTASRKGWIDTADSSNLLITTAGENYVEHDLPGGAD